jgi:hypothetical protein
MPIGWQSTYLFTMAVHIWPQVPMRQRKVATFKGATSSIEPEPTIPQSKSQPNELIVNLQDESQPDKLDSGDDRTSAADTNDIPDHSNDQQWHDTSTRATPNISCYGCIRKPT